MFSFKKLLKKVSSFAWNNSIPKEAQTNYTGETATDTFTSHIDDAIDRGESAIDALYEGGHRKENVPLHTRQFFSIKPKLFKILKSSFFHNNLTKNPPFFFLQ